MSRNQIFKCFKDYWILTRSLHDFQRKIIFESLPSDQQKKLQISYNRGGWEDLFIRNKIDGAINKIKEDIGIDVLEIKSKVSANKSVYLKKSEWDYVTDCITSVTEKDEHTSYAIGGIKAVLESDNVVLLTRSEAEVQ